MVDAALETLKEEGYAGTSARVIAARGGLNPALVFYHFGSVDQLLLAALDKSSTERLERYRTAMSSATPEELVRVAAELFREDVEGGHVTAVTELVGASLARPELRAELLARMGPWLELVRDVLVAALVETPFAALSESAAFAVVALYLGLNLMSRLEDDLSRADALFAQLGLLAGLVGGPASNADEGPST